MIVGFTLGVLISAVVTALFSTYYYGKNAQFLLTLQDAVTKEVAKDIKNAHLAGSVNYRFKQLGKLTKKQMDIVGRLDTPSKGAAHSRWKREIGEELKTLEESKLEIFKSFLEDNVDPLITVLEPNGASRKVKISVFLKEQQDNSVPPPPTGRKSTDSNANRNNVLKLIKETDDGKNSEGDGDGSTIH